MNKIAGGLVLFLLSSCNFESDGAIHKINCDNLHEMYVKDYPKEIDTLIQIQLNEIYKKDSVDEIIFGKVHNSLNLENCKIDTSTFNVQVRVKVGKKYDYWRISYKMIDDKLKEQIFFKRKG